MKQYELPEGFEYRDKYDTKGASEYVLLSYPDGTIQTVNTCYTKRLSSDIDWVGFRFVEPLKVKERYEITKSDEETCFGIWDNEECYECAQGIPTREAAERIKDIYEETTP